MHAGRSAGALTGGRDEILSAALVDALAQEGAHDLHAAVDRHRVPAVRHVAGRQRRVPAGRQQCQCQSPDRRQPDLADRAAADLAERSEEHTSELQSLMRISYAVFCLKKKTEQLTLYQCTTQLHYTRVTIL